MRNNSSFFINLNWSELVNRDDMEGLGRFLSMHRYDRNSLDDNLDHDGNNILMYAVQHGKTEVVKMLLISHDFCFHYQRINNAGHDVFYMLNYARNEVQSNATRPYDTIEKILQKIPQHDELITSKVPVNRNCC